MKIALLYGAFCLSFRKTLDLEGHRSDPRGLSGSELCAVRLFQELQAAGHDVTMFTLTSSPSEHWRPWEERTNEEYEAAISVNVPDDLRGMKAKVRVAYCLLNEFSFCKVGFENHVDLFASPSKSHMDQCLTNEAWRKVEVSPAHPDGKAQWDPAAKLWAHVPLGCDPERYDGFTKAPGRVVYCSSPDRGLHWLLEQWPAIRRAVPHANLRIFYRLRDWLRTFDGTPYFPPIEKQRARTLYVGEALRRLEGHGVEVFDSVSRERIEREMAEAEVLAYPCDPANDYTEGFSVATLEGCAARACPVITDVDALGSIYGEAVPAVSRLLQSRPWQEAWRDNVIKCLLNETRRNNINDRAEALARSMTWTNTATKLMAAIQERL